MLDVFKSSAFTLVTLTDSINKMPYKPGRIGALGYFRERGITTTTASFEEKSGQLSLITSTPRGGVATTLGNAKRTVRSVAVPHFERNATIQADEVQGVRAFGSEDTAEAVQTVVDGRMAELRPMHEVTLEYLRLGAIKGQVIDGDGTTVLANLFTLFGVSQQVEDFAFTTSTTNVRNLCVAVQRLSEAELGGQPVTGYRAICGDAFFDALIAHANVVDSVKYQESKLLRTDLRTGFEYGGITFENYRGKVGALDFVNTDEAYVVPEGADIFRTYFAPADFMETVNTIGLPIYAKVSPDEKFNRSVELHTQSNPLCVNLRPRAVVKLTHS